ncbi:MAG TPA: hypothetical protein VIY48_22260 [Candidatus Paceibacterota bacterium]
MKYAAIIKTTKYVADGWDGSNPEEFLEWKDFKDKFEMEAWVKLQVTIYSNAKYRLIEYNELTVETSVVVKLK